MSQQSLPQPLSSGRLQHVREESKKREHAFAWGRTGAWWHMVLQYVRKTGKQPDIDPPKHPSAPLPEDNDVAMAKTMRLPNMPLRLPTTDAMRKIASNKSHICSMSKDIDTRIREMQSLPSVIRMHPEAVKILTFLGHINGEGKYQYRTTDAEGKTHRVEIPVEWDNDLQAINHFLLGC